MDIANNLNQRLVALLDSCNSNVLHESNDNIEYVLLEEVNPDIDSCLASQSLQTLLDNGFIDEYLAAALEAIRQEYALLEDTAWGDASFIRHSSAWCSWLLSCDHARERKKGYDMSRK